LSENSSVGIEFHKIDPRPSVRQQMEQLGFVDEALAFAAILDQPKEKTNF
jgi:hypothetical protein